MIEPGAPCTFCGVRPDVACRHRAGVERAALPPTPEDKRSTKSHAGQGYNFRKRKFRNGPPA